MAERAAAVDEPRAAGPVPVLDEARVFLTRYGQAPLHGDLGALLAALPRPTVAELRKRGRVRLVVADEPAAVTRERAAGAREMLESLGVPLRVETEKLSWASGSGVRRDAKKTRARLLEARQGPGFLVRQFLGSVTKPTRSEIMGGLITSLPALLMVMVLNIPLFLGLDVGPIARALRLPFKPPASFGWHPVAFAAMTGLSVALRAFHSIFFVDTWTTFRDRLQRLRGLPYLAAFDFAYGQILSALFRLIAWTALAGVAAPWTAAYWRDAGIKNVVGAFVGTLGSQAANELYGKGVVSRGGRSLLQQSRMLSQEIEVVFFKAGVMGAFWPVFWTGQLLDLAFYYVSAARLQARPILYIATREAASFPEFDRLYPTVPAALRSPGERVLEALFATPGVRPLAKLAARIKERLKAHGMDDSRAH